MASIFVWGIEYVSFFNFLCKRGFTTSEKVKFNCVFSIFFSFHVNCLYSDFCGYSCTVIQLQWQPSGLYRAHFEELGAEIVFEAGFVAKVLGKAVEFLKMHGVALHRSGQLLPGGMGTCI